MNPSTDQLIQKLQEKLKELELQKTLSKKPLIFGQASQLMRSLQKEVKDMPRSYQKERLEKQLEMVQHKLSRLERQMMEEVRFVRQTSAQLGVDLEQNGYRYNPRMTVQQNMLRSVIWTEVSQGQMLIKQAELEDIARRMEQNRQVVEQIDRLVKHQGEQLDVMTSHIMFANKNVVEASDQMDQANVLYGGKPRPLQEKPRHLAPIRQSMTEKDIEASRQTISPEQLKIVGSLRSKVRGFFGQLGYKIGQFFTGMFSWVKKPSVPEPAAQQPI